MKKLILSIVVIVALIQGMKIKGAYSDAKSVAEYVNQFEGADYATRYKAWFYSRIMMKHLPTENILVKLTWVKTFEHYDVVVNNLIKNRK